MKFLILLLTVSFALGTFRAQADKGGNGGEPIAQQFVVLAKKLAIFYKENPFHASLPFSADDFKKKTDEIDQSLKNETAKALLECTDDKLYNETGVEKAALFYETTSSIKINRKAWVDYQKDPEGRLALVTMEISGLIGAKNSRYENALALVRNHGAVILSTPLAEDGKGGSNATEGMRIVGQDASQFNRISTLDVLIDGGVLGTGDADNQRVERFLNDPSKDGEWFKAIQSAWKQNRPAYLLLAGPDGNTASITSIYPAVWQDKKEGLGIYSLFFTKFKQIYDGPCAGVAKKLSPLERLTNCYMQSDHYHAYDQLNDAKYSSVGADALAVAMRTVMSGFKGELLYFFAEEVSVLEAAVRDNFLPNYTSIVYPSFLYKQHVLDQTLRANGFEPSLVGPFQNTPYWVKSHKQIIPAIRSNGALKILAETGLAYIDHGTSCTLGELHDQGPKLLPVERLRAYERGPNNTCSSAYYSRPFGQEGQLYSLMVKAGFYYDYGSQIWRRDPSAPAVP